MIRKPVFNLEISLGNLLQIIAIIGTAISIYIGIRINDAKQEAKIEAINKQVEEEKKINIIQNDILNKITGTLERLDERTKNARN